jgi:hypothetical protein
VEELVRPGDDDEPAAFILAPRRKICGLGAGHYCRIGKISLDKLKDRGQLLDP